LSPNAALQRQPSRAPDLRGGTASVAKRTAGKHAKRRVARRDPAAYENRFGLLKKRQNLLFLKKKKQKDFWSSQLKQTSR
jgi:hypothetical protein